METVDKEDFSGTRKAGLERRECTYRSTLTTDLVEVHPARVDSWSKSTIRSKGAVIVKPQSVLKCV